jgi:hypothetical protein
LNKKYNQLQNTQPISGGFISEINNYITIS